MSRKPRSTRAAGPHPHPVESLKLDDQSSGVAVATPISSRHTASEKRKERMGQISVAQRDTTTAVRLISETAHDLRSPLTSIQESVRLVRDGEMGEVNDDQVSMLDSAIGQCECVVQMVGEMASLERLRTGMPRAFRSWVPVANIREEVEQTLQPWSLPRSIRLLWDIVGDADVLVYADAALLRRLLVNLVVNSIRATSDGDWVLVRCEPTRDQSQVRWTVTDQGSGISARDLQRITDRNVSLQGGEGLGLSICRELAALHSSSLSIRSRKGHGTHVWFDVPACGPASVAEAWAQWRCQQRQPMTKPESTKHRPLEDHAGRVQSDPPAMTVQLGHHTSSPRCEDRFIAGTITLGAASARETGEQLDRALQHQMRVFDFVYRVSPRRWVYALDVDARGFEERITDIEDGVKKELPGTRLSWGEPKAVPIDDRRTVARMSDLVVRQSLAGASSTPSDSDQVRLGTAPIEPSVIATRRLDAELDRMSGSFNRQSSHLQHQARKLRPPRSHS